MSTSRPFLFEWQQAVREHQHLSASAKLMLMMLSTYSSLDGKPCFPSQKKLAKDCSKSTRTIKRNLKEALVHGFLDVRRERSGRGLDSNIYELSLPSEKGKGHGCHLPVENEESKGHGCHLAGDMGVTNPGDTHVPPRTQEAKRPQLTTHHHRAPELSEDSQKLLRLWRGVFGSSPPAPHVLRGLSYEELSTALAWTAYQVVLRQRTGNPINNPAGYFVVMLEACRAGEKHLGAFDEEHVRQMLRTKASPDVFFV